VTRALLNDNYNTTEATMLIIEDEKYYDEVVAFANTSKKYDGNDNSCLKSRLDYLERYGGDDRTRVRLYRDRAPYSFGFVIEKKDTGGEWRHLFTGGLLYHGTHDGFGSGAAPTLAVTLEPTNGWSIHT